MGPSGNLILGMGKCYTLKGLSGSQSRGYEQHRLELQTPRRNSRLRSRNRNRFGDFCQQVAQTCFLGLRFFRSYGNNRRNRDLPAISPAPRPQTRPKVAKPKAADLKNRSALPASLDSETTQAR